MGRGEGKRRGVGRGENEISARIGLSDMREGDDSSEMRGTGSGIVEEEEGGGGEGEERERERGQNLLIRAAKTERTVNTVPQMMGTTTFRSTTTTVPGVAAGAGAGMPGWLAGGGRAGW